MLRIIMVCVFVGLVRGGFFDLTDVEDPLALLWHLPIHKKSIKCTTDNNMPGTCMDKPKCMLTGGTPAGHCGLLFTCCSYETSCIKTSSKKQSYFNSGNLSSAVTNCKYTIKLRNKNVCQVRLDFDEHILAPATSITSSTQQVSAPIFDCVNDVMKINPHNYGIPVLCGVNSGQHIYVHVNQTADPNSAINIDITLANRLDADNNLLPKPTWKIRFTQLECPLKRHKFDLSKYGEADNVNNDFLALAPQGAIQYFTEPNGQIRSFGFNETQASEPAKKTSYPYREHYSIAFKTASDICGIQFNPVSLNLLQGTETCKHYLIIPELYVENTGELTERENGGICVGTTPFYSLVPGPLYITFKAMDTTTAYIDSTANQGFLINYELKSTCSFNDS